MHRRPREPRRAGIRAGRIAQAVILSGGGATGAYEAGVVKALLNGKSPVTGYTPFVPEICAGTSVGSFNAAFLVSWLDALGPLAASRLESVWLDRLCASLCGNGLYRFRLDPLTLANPACYFPNPFQPLLDAAQDGASLFWDGLNRLVSMATASGEGLRHRVAGLINFASFLSVEPFRQTIGDTIDFARIRRSRTGLRIPATNWNTGKLTVFKNNEMTDRIGPLAILASSAVPAVLPPVYIGAEPHVDGGVLMNTPLRLVTRHADHLHVVYLDPDVSRIPNSDLESTLAAAYRQQVISRAKTLNDDIGDARAINRVIALQERVARGGRGGAGPEVEIRGLEPILARVKSHDPPYRPLTIHLYHPHDDLTGGPLGFLDLDRDRIRELIERGYSDAVEHDCEASQCVLPAGPGREASSPALLVGELAES